MDGTRYSVYMTLVDACWIDSLGLVTLWHFFMRSHDASGCVVHVDPLPILQHIVYRYLTEAGADEFLADLRERFRDPDDEPATCWN